MSYRNTGTLFTVLVFLFATAGARAWAGSQSKLVAFTVDSVLAADTNEGVDVRIASMGARLRKVFSYTTYRLISRQRRRTQCGRMTGFDLPGGRILHVEPRTVVGDTIGMELVLFQGPRPVMTTELRLKRHAVLMIGGPHYEQGMLIIAITVDTPGSHDVLVHEPRIHQHQRLHAVSTPGQAP